MALSNKLTEQFSHDPEFQGLARVVCETMGDILGFDGSKIDKKYEDSLTDEYDRVRMVPETCKEYSYAGDKIYTCGTDDKRYAPNFTIMISGRFTPLLVNLPAGILRFTRGKNSLLMEIEGYEVKTNKTVRTEEIFKSLGTELTKENRSALKNIIDQGFKVNGYNDAFIKSRSNMVKNCQ